MRRRMTRLGAATMLLVVLVILSASAAAAQGDPDIPPEPIVTFERPGLDSSGPDSGGFIAVVVIFAIIGVGVSIWKFAALRDMGIRRGMSRADATTAAFFSDDAVASTMLLKPEVDDTRRRRLRRTSARQSEPAPQRTIEERLKKVDSLHERGLITQAEAASRRGEILDEI